MEDINLYRSKLRSPNRCRPDCGNGQWDGSMASSSFNANAVFSSTKTFHTPNKNPDGCRNEMSPHKSGYFLRTPSPLKKLQPTVSAYRSLKIDNPGTPSPHKAGSGTDLFGNKSLLDNLDVPEDWDENFLSNFQDDWLFGLGFGNEDLDNLTKSPLKSPKRGLTFLNNTPKKFPSNLSPFKSPLLTSSPKFYNSSPSDKTAAGRPLTRQRKLFLQSPEHHVSHPSNTPPTTLPAPIPFPPMNDTSSSSLFSEGGLESSSIHSISSYLKNFDEEDHQDDIPVMPPAGWTSKGKGHHVGKAATSSKSSSKSKRGKAFTMLQSNFSGNVKAHPQVPPLPPPTIVSQPVQLNHPRKMKVEPQFTLLRPYAELHTNQISLRTAPVTPPNKIKISRDFSQIKTLPSKEQLRIVRNRFRDTLNKAVEQTIEKEKLKRGAHNPRPVIAPTNTHSVINHNATQVQQTQHQPSVQPRVQIQPQPIQTHIQLQTQLHQHTQQTPVQISSFLPQCGITQFNLAALKPPPVKKRRR